MTSSYASNGYHWTNVSQSLTSESDWFKVLDSTLPLQKEKGIWSKQQAGKGAHRDATLCEVRENGGKWIFCCTNCDNCDSSSAMFFGLFLEQN